MLRRFILGGLAVALAAPIVAVTPASAAILFTCTTFHNEASITPGLGHTQTAQSIVVDDEETGGSAGIFGCSNGQSADFASGPLSTFPPRPLGCPVAVGGAGPDYADQTPILAGGDPTFTSDWATGADSTGIAKLKSAGSSNPISWRAVFVITAGQYLAPVGKKTKIKVTVDFTPTDTFTCADNSNPIESIVIDDQETGGSASIIVNQK